MTTKMTIKEASFFIEARYGRRHSIKISDDIFGSRNCSFCKYDIFMWDSFYIFNYPNISIDIIRDCLSSQETREAIEKLLTVYYPNCKIIFIHITDEE